MAAAWSWSGAERLWGEPKLWKTKRLPEANQGRQEHARGLEYTKLGNSDSADNLEASSASGKGSPGSFSVQFDGGPKLKLEPPGQKSVKQGLVSKPEPDQ